MEDNKNTAAVLPEETAEQPTECTMEYVLTRIDRVISDTAYLQEAIRAVEQMDPGEPSMNASGDSARGGALQAIVQFRETTNQQLLRLLEKMYYDLKPAKPDGEMQKLQQPRRRIFWLRAPSRCLSGPVRKSYASLSFQ